ncbi:MAG: DUF308 domain-containing protein [Alphaproteobacteria bacterium]|nr:DUF308 domain-containing protein [Alphaproteobacteria bacterium]
MTQQKKTKKMTFDSDFIKAKVQRLYDKSAPMLLFETVLFALFGVFMLIKPVGFLSVITIVFAGALMLIGFYRVVSGLVASHEYGGGWQDVLFGLVNIILGVLFFAYPLGSIIGMMYLFVLLFIAYAVNSLVFAINMTRARFGYYVFNLILSIILLVIAVSLLFFPLEGAVIGVVLLAILLLIYAAVDFYMFIEITRLKNKVID